MSFGHRSGGRQFGTADVHGPQSSKISSFLIRGGTFCSGSDS
jgi:hypothetical protein